MKTLILIFHLLVCIFEVWMLSDFYDAFLGYKNKGKKRNIFIVLCFALIIFAINSFNNTVLNLSVVPSMYFVLAVVGFSGNIYKKNIWNFHRHGSSYGNRINCCGSVKCNIPAVN